MRELVAHLTMPFRHTGKDVLVAVLQAGGSFDLAADRLARQGALALPPASSPDRTAVVLGGLNPRCTGSGSATG